MSTWALPSRLTLSEAREAFEALTAAHAAHPAGESLVLDASALDAFDTAALSLLLTASRLASASGGRCDVRHAPSQLRQLAELYGVQDLVHWDGNVATPAPN